MPAQHQPAKPVAPDGSIEFDPSAATTKRPTGEFYHTNRILTDNPAYLGPPPPQQDPIQFSTVRPMTPVRHTRSDLGSLSRRSDTGGGARSPLRGGEGMDPSAEQTNRRTSEFRHTNTTIGEEEKHEDGGGWQ